MPRRQRKPRVKVPKPVKMSRPKIKELRMVLKGLLTVSLQNRQASLSYALAWYDAAIPYLLQKGLLSANAQKQLALAVKCRKQGIGTNQDHEKETAFLQAVKIYERACAALKPPSVEAYYKKFEAKKGSLEKKKERMELKFGTVVGLLQKAIGDRIKLEVADAQKPEQYNPALTSLSYNREAAKKLTEKFRTEGLLAVFIEQLPTFARYASLVPSQDIEKQGTWEWSAEKHIQAVEELLKSFAQFSRTADAPKKLVRFGVLKEKTPKVAVQSSTGIQTPRVPRASAKGPRVAGFIVPGTAIALVLERLKDEKEHELKEVIEGLATGDPVGRVKQLGRYGAQKGFWSVAIANGKAQLTMTEAGKQAMAGV